MGLAWEDWVRLALFAAQGITALLLVKMLVHGGRWKRPWAGDAPLFIGLLCLLVVLARVRAYALGSGPFPQTWPTVVNVVGYVALLVWLSGLVSWPWAKWVARSRRGTALRRQRQADPSRRRHGGVPQSLRPRPPVLPDDGDGRHHQRREG